MQAIRSTESTTQIAYPQGQPHVPSFGRTPLDSESLGPSAKERLERERRDAADVLRDKEDVRRLALVVALRAPKAAGKISSIAGPKWSA